jgi:L-fuconolactonase
MRIDAHQHFWSLARGDYGWLTPDLAAIYRDFLPADLRPLIETAEIDRTILVQAAPTEEETAFLLDIARREPCISGVVGWAELTAPDARERIIALAGDPFLVGLRPMIQNIQDTKWMLQASVASSLDQMADCGLVFDALVKPRHLKTLSQLARRHPDLTIVIDHCAKPDIAAGHVQPWANDMAALAEFQNIHVKLSGLMTEASPENTMAEISVFADHVLRIFGPDRIIFGSDWPVLDLASDYATWMAFVTQSIAALAPEQQAAIMGVNAQRVYLKDRQTP